MLEIQSAGDAYACQAQRRDLPIGGVADDEKPSDDLGAYGALGTPQLAVFSLFVVGTTEFDVSAVRERSPLQRESH